MPSSLFALLTLSFSGDQRQQCTHKYVSEKGTERKETDLELYCKSTGDGECFKEYKCASEEATTCWINPGSYF